MTTIRMVETRTGAPDGRQAHRYLAGRVYTVTTLTPPFPDLLPGDDAILSADLADIFVKEGWAEPVTEESADFPDDRDTKPMPRARRK